MATYLACSHSPRTGVDPVTPVHSPHHSVNSSISSRTPLHLTLHEYRKQQNSPASQSATPPGKTLRRKAAAPALKGVERVPSTSSSRAALRPLSLSRSAHQLSYQLLPPSPPAVSQQHTSAEPTFRSQSAEPRRQDRLASQDSFAERVRTFKSIKRLPKPPSTNGPGSGNTSHTQSPPPHASLTTTRPCLSTLAAPQHTEAHPDLASAAGSSESNGTQTTPSTFSLSRFPQPPRLSDPSLSPPHDDTQITRLNAVSFRTTAPATPPATPAVIHYRGASFDLVNPHESLLFHDIVTPSRDLDSTDYLPLRSSEDPLGIQEMAPKRALYGDLSSAYQNITSRRNDDPPSIPDLGLPLPPTPVAQTPGSSQIASPFRSPESEYEVSPLAVRKPVVDARFSLKSLTRSLTKKLNKPPEKVQIHNQEMKEFSESRVSIASISFDGEFPRPLNQSYRAVPPKSPDIHYQLHGPSSPVSPLERADDLQNSDASIEYPRFSGQRYNSAPLTSMVPDEPSTQLARGVDLEPRPSLSEDNMLARQYYDDLESIYPSSSIYTGDDRPQSTYQRSLFSVRQSTPFGRYGGGSDIYAQEYRQDNPYASLHSRGTSQLASRPLTQEIFQRSHVQQGNDKTDTISKFIEQYDFGDNTNTSMPTLNEHVANSSDLVTSPSGGFEAPPGLRRPEHARITSGISHLEFTQPRDTNEVCRENNHPSLRREYTRRPTLAQNLVSAPPAAPALAPPFEYDDIYQLPSRPEQSEVFSGASSYGDTRQLLQLSQPIVAEKVETELLAHALPERTLEPSSSYSQPEVLPSPHTPQEALDQAEKIFESVRAEHPGEASIPAMWSRRNSADMFRSKASLADVVSGEHHQRIPSLAADADDNVADWETENGSQAGGPSVDAEDSIANYSSSESSSRDSMGFSRSLPRVETPTLRSGSLYYQHPSPLATHPHPFNSTPPPLMTSASARSAKEGDPSNSPISCEPVSALMPAGQGEYGQVDSVTSPTQPFAFAPWVDPYGLSNKETLELLASGPNDEIMYESHVHEPHVENEQGERSNTFEAHKSEADLSDGAEPTTTSSPDVMHTSPSIERENTFEKFSILGPKGNLTGTPEGTGMHDAGSSVADNSSPGAVLSSSPHEKRKRQGFPGHWVTPSKPTTVRRGVASFLARPDERPHMHQSVSNFYASPGRRYSVNRIKPRLTIPDPEHERTPSQVTLFPRVIPEEDTSDDGNRSIRSLSSFRRPRRHSRAAVPGQTKLRQMVLAPDAQTLSSVNSSHISRMIRTADSGRPSTCNTNTPLRSHISESTLRSAANEFSPHLLCPERAIDPVEEAQRRKLSWIIFAIYCLLPPMLVLYRKTADFMVANVTKGRLLHASEKPKQIALGVGIAVNLGLSGAILIPILIAHATGAL